jgi:hypothetical protein
MASIAEVFVTVLPETGKIADGIKKALLGADDDVRQAAQRWKRIIDKELDKADATVDVDADTTKAEKELDKLEKLKHTTHLDVETKRAVGKPARCSAVVAAAAASVARSAAPPNSSRTPLTGIALAPIIVPAIGSVVSAVGQLSGVLGLLPAARDRKLPATSTIVPATHAGFGVAAATRRFGTPGACDLDVVAVRGGGVVVAHGGAGGSLVTGETSWRA